MTARGTTYRLVDGTGILIEHFGEPLRLLRDRPVTRPAEARPEGADVVELPRAA